MDEDAAVDGNIVTGTDPEAMPKMFQYITELLGLKKIAEPQGNDIIIFLRSIVA